MDEKREVIQRVNAIEAWHFLPEDRMARWGDRKVLRVGSVLTVEPPLALCRNGLHASIRAIDATQYAPGPIVCRVSVWGEVVRGDNKLCGQYRKILWMADATDVIHRFACDVATEALDLVESKGYKVDPRSRNAIGVKLAWLRGEATDADLGAATEAAWAAAMEAERTAACGAARTAAWGAARAAAWSAGTEAARAAAMATAWAAATGVPTEKQNVRLTDLLMGLRGKTNGRSK